MKVTNIEKFRTELFKNMKDMYFYGCDIHELSKTEFRDSDLEGKEVTALWNPLQIKKSHHDENWKEVVDALYYVTVEEDCVYFFESVKGKKCFKYITSIDYEDYNKIPFMMKVAVVASGLVEG